MCNKTVQYDSYLESHTTLELYQGYAMSKQLITRPTIEDLFSDSGPFDEGAVVEALRPYITIQKSTHEIFFKDSSPTAEQRVLLYALAKKLLKAKELIGSEMITAQEVHKKTGIKKGTIDPIFKKLKETGYLVGKGEYEVPMPKVADAVKSLSKLKSHE